MVVRALTLGTLLAGAIAVRALACGGAPSVDIEPSLTFRVDETLQAILANDPEWAYVEASPEQLRLLYPVVTGAADGTLSDLWKSAYEPPAWEDAPPPDYRDRPSTADLDAAVTARDWPAAERAATALVQRILDMPAPQADLHRLPFNRALELLELLPRRAEVGDEPLARFLRTGTVDESGPKVLEQAKAIRTMSRDAAATLLGQDPTQPRAATLRFVELTRTLQRTVPNGWLADVAAQLPAGDWARLERLVDDWLAEFPSHPLADLVRLMKLRLYYFQHRLSDAFGIVLDVLPRHRPRALYELRYLVMQGFRLDMGSPIAERLPWELRAGFVPAYATNIVPAELWAASAAHADAPWAINLQERLLYDRIDDPGPLPEWFPSEPAAPTPMWARLRLLALVRHGRWDDAERQAALLPGDAVTAPLRGAIRLARGDAWGALREGLPETARQYVIRVLLSDDELGHLSTTGTDWERDEASTAIGIRRAMAGDWRGAAQAVRRGNPARAALWDECAKRAAITTGSGPLEWARFLVEHRGEILYEVSGAWYRSLDQRQRGTRTPHTSVLRAEWTASYEREAIRRHLLRNERWLALQAYVAFLEHTKDPALRRTALHEADDDYNSMINFTMTRPHFWDEYLAHADVVRRLRAIGVIDREQPAPGP